MRVLDQLRRTISIGLLVTSCSSHISTSPPQGEAGTTAASRLPPECAGGHNPFIAEECGRALKTLCRSQLSERDCTVQGPFSFTEAGYVFLCGWAKVVTFSDTATCAIESVRGRCEAAIIAGDIGCKDPCDAKTGHRIYDSLVAIRSESALVEMPCDPFGAALSGPVGEWTALSNQPQDYVHSCGADVPPPPAELCACTPVACNAK
jgi:hypothetical protein